MSTLTDHQTTPAPAVTVRERRQVAPIPMTRMVGVELRKMFDTRSGFWLLASIGILSVLATVATIVFAPEAEQTYEAFATAIGFPMAVILPMIAILSITSEWSQRSGLTTFTLVPSRSRVIAAKAIGSLIIAVVSMFVALGTGAVGNIVGTTISGAETTWNVEPSQFALIVLANVLGMAIGFMLGVLIRNSPGAIVSYFVYSLLFPTMLGFLAAFQEWFRDLQPWVDFNYAQTRLYDETLTSDHWAQLGTSSILWLVLPLAVGLVLVTRSEVK